MHKLEGMVEELLNLYQPPVEQQELFMATDEKPLPSPILQTPIITKVNTKQQNFVESQVSEPPASTPKDISTETSEVTKKPKLKIQSTDFIQLLNKDKKL